MIALVRQFILLGADPDLAHLRAIAAVDGLARRESFIMAFSDSFFLMGATFLVGGALVCLLQRVKPGAGGAPAH